MTRADEVIELAGRWHEGDRKAGDALFVALGDDLHHIVAAKLRSERQSSLSTGDLVNEAVIRLSRQTEIGELLVRGSRRAVLAP